jgi:hypothetical protein
MVGSIQAASNLRTQSAKGGKTGSDRAGASCGATKSASNHNIASITPHTKGSMVVIPNGQAARSPTEIPQKPREQTRMNARGPKGKALSLFDLFGRVLRS